MHQKRVLLLGGNYFPEPTGIGKFNGEMINWMAAKGLDCSVVTTYPYYPFWNIQDPYKQKSYWYSTETDNQNSAIKIYRCPHYVPSSPTGAKRILSDISFFVSAFFRVILLLFVKKYDYVITVAPPFQIGFLGLLYKWIKGAKHIYHIQDLQIDAAQELGMIKSKRLLTTMFRMERFILAKSDYISSISEGMINKIIFRSGKPVLFFPNWTDTVNFYPVADPKNLRHKFNLSNTDKIVLYSGAIGEKQGLENIIYAAEQLKDSEIKFVICGTGPYKEKLVSLASKLKLANIIFLPLQSKENFNDFLNSVDLHLILQKGNANDLVMPSKLSTILSVGGLALITAHKKSSLYKVVSRNDMGILVEPENLNALVDSLKSALFFESDNKKINARRFAQEFLTIDKVIERFVIDTGISKPLVEIERKSKEVIPHRDLELEVKSI